MIAAPFKEISVFEPDLRTLGSHHCEYTRLLRAAADRAALPLRVFCHQDAEVEVQRQTGAEPLFPNRSGWQSRLAAFWPLRHCPPALSWFISFLHNQLFSKDFRRAFCQLDWDGQLILVPNCHHGMVGGLARALREPLRRHPRAGAVLVFPFLPSKHMFPRYFREIVPLVHAGRAFLATDSEPLAALYLRLTGLRFAVLPMPYGALASAPAAPPANSGARFLVCGGHRMEKGIDLLADLIETQEAAIVAGAMLFTLQGFADETAPDPEAARHFARIKASAARCPPGRITLIESTLTAAEYHALFERCDAVLLPYRHAAYAIRTSGVLTECLSRGKPVVTTADTWLGQQVQTHGAGLTVPDGDVEALTRATCQLAAELPRFAAEAQARRPAWRAFHNPDNYLRALGGLLDAPARTRA